MPSSAGKAPDPPEIYTLSLHDALPISAPYRQPSRCGSLRQRFLCGQRTERSSIRSEEHTSELQSLRHLVCRLLLVKPRTLQRSTLFPYTTLFRSLHPTGNPLDVALSGKGFFAVNGPSGPLYTRNGSFRLAADGKLTSADGYPVRDSQGAPLTLQATRPLEISSDGTVTQDGVAAGQLEIVDFTSTAGLSKQGNNYFRVNDPAALPAAPSATSVEQGHLESSNTGTAESAVRLVSVMRQFEMLQKAVTLGTEMNKKAIEEVAKV